MPERPACDNCAWHECKYHDTHAEEHCAAPTLEAMKEQGCPYLEEKHDADDQFTEDERVIAAAIGAVDCVWRRRGEVCTIKRSEFKVLHTQVYALRDLASAAIKRCQAAEALVRRYRAALGDRDFVADIDADADRHVADYGGEIPDA